VEARRVDGAGVLAWTDPTQKDGGLTFRGLSLEAREAIRKWIEQSAMGFAADDAVAKSPAPPLLGSGDPLAAAGFQGSAPTEALLAAKNPPMQFGGFARGLLSGLLISTGIVYPLDAVVSTAGERGPKTLLEIQCRGMDRTVKIDESKPVRYFTPPPQQGA
jgi:hypothetical protein